MDKKNLLVSFSGGETSAFMAQWLLKHKQDEFNMVFVFANTGEENEETLEFVEKCNKHFSLNVHWVEAVVHHGQRKGTTHKVVDFKTASRNGEPFKEVISKYGIPNQMFLHCTRETKLNPITSFCKNYFDGQEYYTAVGIRIDESDRISAKHKENKIIYPLISRDFIPMNKEKINFWWSQQNFRLNLKGYQGNCKTCWKKSDHKLFTIAKETPEFFQFNKEMEKKYSKGKYFFFRNNRSTEDILEEAKKFKGVVKDDSQNYNWDIDIFENESCDIWSSCGD